MREYRTICDKCRKVIDTDYIKVANGYQELELHNTCLESMTVRELASELQLTVMEMKAPPLQAF